MSTIKVWAPLASKVAIVAGNQHNINMQKLPFGYWLAESERIKPGLRYMINIDGKTYPDPVSLSQPEGVHKASEIIDINEIRRIHHPGWQSPPLKDLIIYELHTGTFTPEGTFEGIRKKIDYLLDLGITAINIMPVASFPGTRNWGYDGAYPYSVHAAYGGARELALLVKECHNKGMAVILDVVYNHLGPEGNYLGAIAPYFTEKYKTPWGNAINYDDAWCDGVRDYFIQNALMWLRDFNIDGLRLDAVHAIKDFSPKHFLRELAEQVEHLNQRTGSSHFLIAECDLNDTRYIQPLSQNGYGMHSQWCDEWHHALHALLTGEKTGYYSDFGDIEQLCKSFNNAYVFTGEFSHHRKKHFGTPTNGFPGEKFVIFTQNHDHTGNRMLGERLSNLLDFESLKLAAGAMLLSPFIPLLFMGEEYAEDSPFLYFIDHGDKDLVKAVQEGRKNEFKSFGDFQPPDPASQDTFLQSKLKWDFNLQPSKQRMLSLYRELIEIRKRNKHFFPLSERNYNLATCTQNTITLTYNDNNEKIIVIMNFSNESTLVEIEEKELSNSDMLLYSAHQKWGGNIANSFDAADIIKRQQPFEMVAKSFVIFRE